ncbi:MULTISPECIES: hypothetical protein [unclassified Corynebacterium]|uniref:hypothetical protein n=1 Tax=unclassified Corynebacterium TaxID=2624378 RepID=UPI00163DB22C|nr:MULTISPECIES: hypothetical protein [unclassified Corynebacterium]
MATKGEEPHGEKPATSDNRKDSNARKMQKIELATGVIKLVTALVKFLQELFN